MSNFQHDIAGGAGNLIATSVQSPNYQTGVSGWQIRKDGSAEFNNLAIRGTFDGTDYEINTNGIFFYSGTPALGNLVLSSAPAAGTDSHGNAYLAGTTTYTLNGGTYTATALQSGQLNAYTAPAAGGPWTLVGSLAFDPTSGWLAITLAPLNCEHSLFVSGGSFLVTNSIPATFTGNVTINGTLTVGGSSSTSTNGLTDGTTHGTSNTSGLTDGTINGTSGGASAGTAHTHGPGSFAVTNGQHSHGPGSFAVGNGQHSHTL